MKNLIENGKYQAIEDVNFKYIYSLGGGLKGRTIKKGDVVTVIGWMNDVNSQSVCSLELLHRVEINSFKKLFIAI